MARVIFDYNLEKDEENYIGSLYRLRRLSHGRRNYQKMAGRYLFPEDYQAILTARNEEEAKEIVKRIIGELLGQNKEMFILVRHSLEKAWREKEKRFFILLENFFEKPLYFKKVDAFFTTLPVCPYNRRENWFMVSFRYGLEEQLKTIFHELMHFMFLGYYWNYTYQALGGTSEKVEIIKEALTVFLNTDCFREVNTVCDQGYPKEKRLREYLLSIRREKKDFHGLLNEAINFLKANPLAF